MREMRGFVAPARARPVGDARAAPPRSPATSPARSPGRSTRSPANSPHRTRPTVGVGCASASHGRMEPRSRQEVKPKAMAADASRANSGDASPGRGTGSGRSCPWSHSHRVPGQPRAAIGADSRRPGSKDCPQQPQAQASSSARKNLAKPVATGCSEVDNQRRCPAPQDNLRRENAELRRMVKDMADEKRHASEVQSRMIATITKKRDYLEDLLQILQAQDPENSVDANVGALLEAAKSTEVDVVECLVAPESAGACGSRAQSVSLSASPADSENVRVCSPHMSLGGTHVTSPATADETEVSDFHQPFAEPQVVAPSSYIDVTYLSQPSDSGRLKVPEVCPTPPGVKEDIQLEDKVEGRSPLPFVPSSGVFAAAACSVKQEPGEKYGIAQSLPQSPQMSPAEGSRSVCALPCADAQNQQAEAELQPGARVRVHGLRQALRFNNQVGILQSVDEHHAHWIVRFQSGELQAVRVENLQALQAERNATKCEVERNAIDVSQTFAVPPPSPEATEVLERSGYDLTRSSSQCRGPPPSPLPIEVNCYRLPSRGSLPSSPVQRARIDLMQSSRRTIGGGDAAAQFTTAASQLTTATAVAATWSHLDECPGTFRLSSGAVVPAGSAVTVKSRSLSPTLATPQVLSPHLQSCRSPLPPVSPSPHLQSCRSPLPPVSPPGHVSPSAASTFPFGASGSGGSAPSSRPQFRGIVGTSQVPVQVNAPVRPTDKISGSMMTNGLMPTATIARPVIVAPPVNHSPAVTVRDIPQITGIGTPAPSAPSSAPLTSTRYLSPSASVPRLASVNPAAADGATLRRNASVKATMGPRIDNGSTAATAERFVPPSAAPVLGGGMPACQPAAVRQAPLSMNSAASSYRSTLGASTSASSTASSCMGSSR